MTRKTHVHLSDLAGLNRLATDVTAELTDLAEALHNNIACSPGILPRAILGTRPTCCPLQQERLRMHYG
jgi:hypothetical protein